MNKAISLVLLAVFVSSLAGPAAGQKRAVELRKNPLSKKETVPQSQPQFAAPTSTEFGDIGAYTDGSGVYIAWYMRAEVGNIGFNIYRIGKDGFELLNPAKLVAGSAMNAREVPTYGMTYNYFDRAGSGNEVYYVEAIGLNGTRTASQHLSPYHVSDLSVVSGKTSLELAASNDLTTGQSETSELGLTKELYLEREENQMLPDPVTHREVISQPGVARIGVKNTGIYRVMRAQLEAAGFNVNSNSANWQLYVEGVQQAMLIGPNADYIEFYGKGTDTRETDIRQYYLLNGASAGIRMATKVAAPAAGTVVTPNYYQTFNLEENTNYLDDIYNGEAENYFGRGFGASQTTLNFNLSGVDMAGPSVHLSLRFQGYSPDDHVVEVTLNDQVLAPIDGDPGEVTIAGQYVLTPADLREGVNSIKFRAAGPSDFIFFDEMNISFGRRFLAQQNKLSFYTQNYRKARLEGFSSANVRVFDLTHEGAPALVTNLTFQPNGPTFGVDMPAARGRVFYAVEDSAINAPFSVTANNPELVGVPTNGADLVIIAYKDFMTQAEAWANYRRGQNFTVKVIEVSELYDEFNYGALGSGAIKSFLQYAHTTWQNPPDYVLLIGDASVDSRNYENQGYWNMVPTPIVSAVFTEVASDDNLTDFNDDGLAEISVGRIASRTAVGITNAFNKTVQWETYANPHLRGALFAYDRNDTFYNFAAISNNVMAQIPGEIPKTTVFRDEANANTNLLNAMNAGKWMVNYTGHGTTGSWGGNPVFFNIFSINSLPENPTAPSVFTMLTCLNGAFHYLFNDSFAEVLTKANNKGAVAAWASSGLTIATTQETMGVRFYTKAGNGSIPRLGDLTRDAKIDAGDDVRKSWILIGDPMLKVR
jgi:hypothetical protein